MKLMLKNLDLAMKKILINLVTVAFCLSLFGSAWGIEREKKAQPPKKEQRPPAAQTEKKPETPVEIAPPKEAEKPVTREPQQPPEEKKVEKPVTTEADKIKLPPLERKLIDQIDRFVDKNGNGIDDRLEGKEKQAEKPKLAEKKKKRD